MSKSERRVRPRIWRPVGIDVWDAAWFQTLTPTGRLLYFLVVAGPYSNRAGLFRFSVADAAERLGADAQQVKDELSRLCVALRWRYDAARRVIWIPSWWLDNPSFCQNESCVRAAVKDLLSVPTSPLLAEFIGAGVQSDCIAQERFEKIADEILGDEWRVDDPANRAQQGVEHGVQQGAQHGAGGSAPPTLKEFTVQEINSGTLSNQQPAGELADRPAIRTRLSEAVADARQRMAMARSAAACFCGAMIRKTPDGRTVLADTGEAHDQAACSLRERAAAV
jgi:hypothetical protein